MNLNPLRSIAAQLGRLSVSVARTSVRQASSKKKRREKIPPSFPPGHGEKIWIYSNFINGQTVYSHDPVLKANRALRQLPFNGKKLKPAKLRKDYWRPMAMIQFPEGLGHIGRSVYHIMREFRKRHDLDWGDEMFRDDATGRPLTRFERGQKLNSAQKANAIADMAAVLGGVGKGNKMWLPASDSWASSEEQRVDEKTGETTALLKTQVWWTNDLDRNYAQSWPDNVAHFNFTEGVYQPLDLQREAEATAQGTPEAAAEPVTQSS